ncbi:MAG: YtxH domain-containing protein [Anaerolineales bacterium]|nr:YtxH domain-containing protein [Anaerolineales bacterium]
MSENNDFGAFFSGFLIGGLAGAITALLLAPQSGEETRDVIKTKGIELKDKTIETIDDARRLAEKAADDARRTAEEYSRMAQDQAEKLQKQSKVILDEQKKRLEKARSAGKKVSDTLKEEIEEIDLDEGEAA